MWKYRSRSRSSSAWTVSIDPRDTPGKAKLHKDHYLGSLDREGAGDGWHFLTGDPESVDRLTRATGFRFAWDEETEQFAHPAGVLVAGDNRPLRAGKATFFEGGIRAIGPVEGIGHDSVFRNASTAA